MSVVFSLTSRPGVERSSSESRWPAESRNAPSVPFVVRLDGTNDVEGRQILADAALPNVYTASTMNEAAEKVVELAATAGAAR